MVKSVLLAMLWWRMVPEATEARSCRWRRQRPFPTADPEDDHVLVRFQVQSFQQHPRCNIRGAADAADANTFCF